MHFFQSWIDSRPVVNPVAMESSDYLTNSIQLEDEIIEKLDAWKS